MRRENSSREQASLGRRTRILWLSPAVSCLILSAMSATRAGAQPTVVTGGEIFEYAVFPSLPGTITIDAADNIFAGNFNETGSLDGPAHVYRVDANDSTVANCGPQIDDPDAVYVDLNGILGDPGSVLVGGVQQFAPENKIAQLEADCSSSVILTTDACIGNVNAMAEDSEGRLYAANAHGSASYVCVLDGEWSVFTEDPTASAGIAIESPDIYIAWDGQVRLYDTNASIADSSFAMGSVLGIGPPGPFEGVLISRADSILAVDPATKQETVLVVDITNGASGVVFDSAGDLFFKSRYRIYHVTKGTATSAELHDPLGTTISVSPNPFSSTAFVSFHLRKRAAIQLQVYDVKGRSVRALIDRSLAAGYNQIAFPAAHLPNGTYFLRGHVGTSVVTKKVHVLR